MVSTVGGPSMRIQAQEGTGLLPRMDPAGGESAMRKQADEESQASKEATSLWLQSMEHIGKPRKEVTRRRQTQQEIQEEQRIAKIESRDRAKAKPMEAMDKAKKAKTKTMDAKKAKATPKEARAKVWKAKDEEACKAEVSATEAGKAEEAVKGAKVNEEAGKAEASVTEVGIPEESVTESGTQQESLADAGNRQKVMGKETLQQLLKDMPNKFDRLDPDGDDEKDEIDRGKSAIEEERMPSDGKNPSDRGEESVKLGSGKSTMDKKEVMGKAETLHTPEYGEKLMKHNKERNTEQEALLADKFNKFCQSKSGNSAGAGKSIIPAYPSATKSMGQHSVQGELDHDDRGKSAAAAPAEMKTTAAEKEMADEAKNFASHRKNWESKHGKRCGLFSETTLMSSMQFTHYTPGLRAHNSATVSTPKTLQIFSIKLPRLDGGLEFPLSVYGVVAVRDLVDRNRNILFSRDISRSQELKQNDPFLHLIGPSRAILFAERVWFEIELRVWIGSQNKALISCARRYSGGYGDGLHTICFNNCFCTLEVSTQTIKQTVQATILSVEVVQEDGSWPLKYGGLVACSPRSGELAIIDGRLGRNIDPSSGLPILLVHSKHEAVPRGYAGFVCLRRQVVSVEYQGRLDFDIKSYSKSGAIAAEASACFEPELSNISVKKCLLGDAEVNITVAWSRVSTYKMGVV